MDYAVKESRKKESLYIIKVRYSDMSITTGRAYYAYNLFGWAYKGAFNICEKEKFKKLRIQQLAINKCREDCALWLCEETDKLYSETKDKRLREKKLRDLLNEKEKREKLCIEESLHRK